MQSRKYLHHTSKALLVVYLHFLCGIVLPSSVFPHVNTLLLNFDIERVLYSCTTIRFRLALALVHFCPSPSNMIRYPIRSVMYLR